MGMSAGQARLLSITTRLTNNEFRAQTITNSKLRLADDSTEASNEYMKALESKKLMFCNYNGDGAKNYTALTANSILTFADLKNQYSLVNTAGKILLNGSDIKNYEASETLGDFLEKYGVAVTDNPNYTEAMDKLYGPKFSEYVKKQENAKKYKEAFNGIVNTFPENISDLDANSYQNIITTISGMNLPNIPGTSIYGTMYGLLNSLPAYVEKPDAIPDFQQLVTDYNGSQCYSSVSATTNGIGHMEHNLAALIWSMEGLGNNSNTRITNSAGNITVDRNATIIENNGRTQYVSLTNYSFTDTEASENLLNGLNSCNYECVTDMKQQIINLYCDVINFLHKNGGIGTSTTQLNSGRYNINSTASSKTASALVNEWNSMYASLASMATTAQTEYNNEFAIREEFEREVSSIINDFKNYLEVYTNFEVPQPEIPDQSDSKYQWYVNLWNRMGAGEQDANDNKNTAKYTELDPNLLNNQEWLEFALEHGVLTMEQAIFNEDGSPEYPGMGTFDWVTMTYTNASDIVSQEDEVAIAIAEAKYKREMTEIENKDKQYDQDLKKLDTEHTALQTEYESIKSVIQKNVERSFKAFS